MIQTALHKPALVVLLTCIGACLGPNPRLEDCGEKWVIEADDAWYKDSVVQHYQRNCAYIDENYDCVLPRGELCLNRDQANDLLTNPDSLILSALQAKAIADCKQVAIGKSAIWENCETGIGAPFYEGRCMLDAEQCNAGYETGGESDSETGSGAAPLPIDGISCSHDLCSIPAHTLEALLAANEASLWADGTTLAPHHQGWQLGGVQRGNLGGVLGFVDGDVVTAIDGRTIVGWDALLDAINRVFEAERVQLSVLHDGRAITRTFVRTP